MTFADFQQKWLNPGGQRVDFDHVYKYQCVDLILEYLYECYGINGAYGNAIDYWNRTDAKILARFSKIPNSDAIAGDIVVFNGNPGNPFGHIGIATGNINGNDVEVMEQNGQTGDGSGQAGDAIRTRYILRSRVAGILRATNVPAPAPPPPSTPSLPDGAYTAESPVYKEIVKDIPGYMTATNAANHVSPVTTVKAGNHYFLFTSKYGMDNVTLVSGNPGAWINPSDNVIVQAPPPPPAPEPEPVAPPEPDWRTSYQIFRNKFGDAEPRYYVAMHDTPVPDLETKRKDLQIHQYSIVSIGGTFVKDGVTYGRPKSAADKFLWYGIAMNDPVTGTPNLELESEVYSTATDTATRRITKTVKPRDYLVLATATAEKAYDTLEKVMDIFVKKKVKK